MGANQQVFAALGGVVVGQQEYSTSEGTFTWVAPVGVANVSAVVVGSGKTSGVGGALAYKNNISVIPGNSYTVFVSSVGCVRSYFVNNCTVSAGFGNNRTGDGGGNGANPGGAGGYSGNGGLSSCSGAGAAGTGGAGGGGGYATGCIVARGAGGGVGLLGAGTSGAGGFTSSNIGGGGGGGSGGANGGASSCSSAGNGGLFGGGQGFGNGGCISGTGGRSAVRIIWPGCARSFPSTRTGNE